MINYGRIQASEQPQEIEITNLKVFIAENINPFEKEIDGRTFHGFEYDYKEYTKDEYIQLITKENSREIATLREELAAAKILLGVE